MDLRKYGLIAMFISVFIVSIAAQVVFAEETTGEKITATANDAKRSVKKGAHRLKEAVCAEGDLKCTSKKVKNRAVEVKDATVDGAKEIKNKID